MRDLLVKPTKCLLVHPIVSKHNFLNFRDAARFVGAKYTTPPLGLMTVAALLPQHWEFRLIDENVRPLKVEDIEWADIVLTGGILPQRKEILAIIKRVHDKGKPVVIGGPGPTSRPHIYEKADFLVPGRRRSAKSRRVNLRTPASPAFARSTFRCVGRMAARAGRLNGFS